jgi:uncharacterized protein YuzE
MAVADNYLRLLPALREAREHSVKITYDHIGDVLYVLFEPGVESDDGDEIGRDVIEFRKGDRLVSYTILNASKHGLAG